MGMLTGLEATIVPRKGLAFRAIPAGPVLGRRGWRLATSLGLLLRGCWGAWRAMGAARPRAVFITGGYVSVPVAIAAWLRRVPILVYLPDVRPGLAVRLVARLADRIAVTCDAAARHFDAGRTRVTGYPVRSAIRAADRAAARRSLSVGNDDPVVLVFGGSQGARRLNAAVAGGATRLLAQAHVIHVTGPAGHDAAVAAVEMLDAGLRSRYHLHAYLHDDDMAAALAAADVAVCRAGAATLGELPARGLPAVLVPLPIAGGHQADNARVLVDAGAAVLVDDGDLDAERLVAVVGALLDDPDRRAVMAAAMRRLDRPDAPSAIWDLLAELAGGVGGGDTPPMAQGRHA